MPQAGCHVSLGAWAARCTAALLLTATVTLGLDKYEEWTEPQAASVEGTVASARRVFLATIAVAKFFPAGTRVFTDEDGRARVDESECVTLSLSVRESLKGAGPGSFEVTIRGKEAREYAKRHSWIDRREYLVFAIDFNQPFWIPADGSSPQMFCTSDLEILTDGKSVLRATRKCLASNSPPPTCVVIRHLPAIAGIAESAVVAVSPTTEAWVTGWLCHHDPTVRANAVETLAAMGTPSAVQSIRGMLEDPYFKVQREGKHRQRHYPIRQAATELLARIAPPPPSSVVNEPQDQYRSLKALWRWWVYPLAVVAAVAVLWRLIGGPSLCPSRVLRLTRATLLASLWLAAAMGVLWARSYWRVDHYVHRHGDARWELCSARGRLTWTTIAYWPYERVEGYACMRFGDLDPVWDLVATGSEGRTSHDFVRWDSFNLRAAGAVDDGRQVYTWSAIVIPWPLAALVLIVLAGGLHLSARWTVRQWAMWRRWCVRCGYDMRATPDRCPECGWTPESRYSPKAVAKAIREERQAEAQHEAEIDRAAAAIESLYDASGGQRKEP